MSYRSGEVGERRLDPQGGVGVDSEFVVPAAQDPDEGVDGVQLSSLLARRLGRPASLAGFTLTTVLAAEAIVPLQQAHAGVAGLLACLWVFVAAAAAASRAPRRSPSLTKVTSPAPQARLHGFTAFTVAGLVSPLAGLVGIGNVTPVATVPLTTSATALLSVGLLLRSIPGRERPPAREGTRATPERR
jgi:MFS transporter, DHA1 family, multidrug resistance protein